MVLRRWGVLVLLSLVAAARPAAADVPLGGFIPYVGIGLTDEFETFDSDPDGTFFIADRAPTWGGSGLGPGAATYFDVALLDTGAATHILTPTAAGPTGFSIQAEGLRGTNFQSIFGASGSVELRINDPLGFYAAGLGPGGRTGQGAALTMNTNALRGQTSFATLEAPVGWTLPNIMGLPMAAHYGFAILNSQPQIFTLGGRTVRTPNIELIDLGTGGQRAQQLGVTRRTELQIRPSASFLTGPVYVQNFDLGGGLEFHDNPLSPSVLDSGAMFVETDMAHGSRSIQDKEFLFDTGADLTVVSELTAARLGFDVVNDAPDFLLEVEGAGGVTGGVPGFYVDELNIDAVGGSFTLHNVPVAVLDLPSPNDPANVLDGILGTHLFTGRDVIIDPNPAPNQIGAGPRLYIGDEVTETHTWAIQGTGLQARFGEFTTAANWSPLGTPSVMWVAEVRNTLADDQFPMVSANSTVNQLHVTGAFGQTINLTIQGNVTLTTFGETRIDVGGAISVGDGGKLDAQFVNIQGGVLRGDGDVFVGTGPLNGAVRNLSGRIEPGATIGALAVTGDVANLDDGTIAIQLAGTTAGSGYDQLQVGRLAFLDGTLEVSLSNFTPSVGNEFTIITAGEGIVGEFEQLILPGGFQWDVDYQANAVVLQVAGLAALAGDFDNNGMVNAADLVAFRNGYGTTYAGQDFLTWQRNLGAGAIGAAASVPEPSALALLLIAGCHCWLVQQRRPGTRRPLPGKPVGARA